MKILFITIFGLLSIGSFMSSSSAGNLNEPSPLLPESLAARSEMAASKKTVTIFLSEDDPEKATGLLNLSNDDYAQKGWTVFTIQPYIQDGDFDGFFVTYERSIIIN